MISFLKFDLDICEQIDSIFKEYGIKVSYKHYIESLQKKYKDKMDEFCDNYGRDVYINLNDFGCIKPYLNRKFILDKKEGVIYIENGFIKTVYVPSKLNGIVDIDEFLKWEPCYIETIEDLKESLKLFKDRFMEYVKVFDSPDVKKIMKELSKSDKEFEKQRINHRLFKEKNIKQINKHINIINDF